MKPDTSITWREICIYLYQILMDQWNVTYRTLVTYNATLISNVSLFPDTIGDRGDATACEIFLQYCIYWVEISTQMATLTWGGGRGSIWQITDESEPTFVPQFVGLSSCLAFSVYTMVSHLYQILMDQWNVTYRTLINALMSVSELL